MRKRIIKYPPAPLWQRGGNIEERKILPSPLRGEGRVRGFDFRAPLKTVLFRDGGVSRVLTSSCIRPYTPVFRTRLPCPHKKCLVCRAAHESHVNGIMKIFQFFNGPIKINTSLQHPEPFSAPCFITPVTLPAIIFRSQKRVFLVVRTLEDPGSPLIYSWEHKKKQKNQHFCLH